MHFQMSGITPIACPKTCTLPRRGLQSNSARNESNELVLFDGVVAVLSASSSRKLTSYRVLVEVLSNGKLIINDELHRVITNWYEEKATETAMAHFEDNASSTVRNIEVEDQSTMVASGRNVAKLEEAEENPLNGGKQRAVKWKVLLDSKAKKEGISTSNIHFPPVSRAIKQKRSAIELPL